MADLLVGQHRRLRESATALPVRRGIPRLDAFLGFRRRLAVHLALEDLVLPGHGGGPGLPDLDERVRAAEACEIESAGFEDAWSALLSALARHAELQEEHLPAGPEAPPDDGLARVADEATYLWRVEGEVHGRTHDEMRRIVREHLLLHRDRGGDAPAGTRDLGPPPGPGGLGTRPDIA